MKGARSHPARGPAAVLRLRRAEPRSVAARPAGHRRRARDDLSLVAAVSREARAAGVRVGPARRASPRRLCPDAAVVPGDLEAYARVSDEVTAILLAASRRVERPSADEAYVDLTRDGGGAEPGTRRRGASRTTCSAGSASTRRSASPPRGSRRASPRPGLGRAGCSWCCPATRRRSWPASPCPSSKTCRRTSSTRSTKPASGRSASWPRPTRRRSRRSSARTRRIACGPPRPDATRSRSRPPRRPPGSRRRRRSATAGPTAKAARRGRGAGRPRQPPPASFRRGRRHGDGRGPPRPGLRPRATTTSTRRRGRGHRATGGARAGGAAGRRRGRRPLRPGAAQPPRPARRGPGLALPRARGARPLTASRLQSAREGEDRRRPAAPRAPPRRSAPRRSWTGWRRRIPKPPARCTTRPLRARGRHHPVRPVHGRAREHGHARALPPLSRPGGAGRARSRRSWRASSARPGSSARRARACIGCAPRARRSDTAARSRARWPSSSKLPGIGRKTANVVLGHAYDIAEGIAVDTHVLRVSNRLGIAQGRRPDGGRAAADGASCRTSAGRAPRDLLIFHGRKICDARRPRVRRVPGVRAVPLGAPPGVRDGRRRRRRRKNAGEAGGARSEARAREAAGRRDPDALHRRRRRATSPRPSAWSRKRPRAAPRSSALPENFAFLRSEGEPVPEAQATGRALGRADGRARRAPPAHPAARQPAREASRATGARLQHLGAARARRRRRSPTTGRCTSSTSTCRAWST